MTQIELGFDFSEEIDILQFLNEYNKMGNSAFENNQKETEEIEL